METEVKSGSFRFTPSIRRRVAWRSHSFFATADNGFAAQSGDRQAVKPRNEIMLVLSRKDGQSIVVAGNITITVSSISRGRVKIGVEAPRHCSIRRVEQPLSDRNPPVCERIDAPSAETR